MHMTIYLIAKVILGKYQFECHDGNMRTKSNVFVFLSNSLTVSGTGTILAQLDSAKIVRETPM